MTCRTGESLDSSSRRHGAHLAGRLIERRSRCRLGERVRGLRSVSVLVAGGPVTALEERRSVPAPVDAVAGDAWAGQLHDLD